MRTRAIVISFIAMNLLVVAVVLANRSRSDNDPFTERMITEAGDRGELLMQWLEAPQQPLDKLQRGQRSLSGSACLRPPVGTPLPWSQLTPLQSADLSQAIGGLAQAYQASTADALLAYMAERGERVTKPVADGMAKMLIDELGHSPTELTSMSPDDVFRTFWQAAGVSTRWEAYLPQHSCCTLWLSQSWTAAQLRDARQIAADEVAVWGKRLIVNHNFAPEGGDPLADATRGRVPILVADVKLMIQHRDAGIHGLAPYFVRFWYNENQQKWQPLFLACIRVSNEIPSRMLF